MVICSHNPLVRGSSPRGRISNSKATLRGGFANSYVYIPMGKVFKPELIDLGNAQVDVAVGDLESANDCDGANAADSECKAVN